MEAKSQLFLKYFTLFMNLLNDCGEAGGTVITSGHGEGKEEGGGPLQHGPRPRLSNANNNSLRNATIQVGLKDFVKVLFERNILLYVENP